MNLLKFEIPCNLPKYTVPDIEEQEKGSVADTPELSRIDIPVPVQRYLAAQVNRTDPDKNTTKTDLSRRL